MAVYSVHLPRYGGERVAEAAFVREGFHWSAFLFGALWLLWRGIWLALAVWLAFCLLLSGLAAFGFISTAAFYLVVLLLHLLLGFEANRLIETRLERRGYRLVQIVAARALDEAQFAFFRHIEAPDRAIERDLAAGERGDESSGLFPQSGDRR